MANPIVTITMTDGSVMKAELYPEVAPNTVNNFISLVKKGFYDGLVFHRVIRGFMIQGGDPEGTGYGGSKDVIPDEFGDGLTFDEPGILAMANAGPNTGRSQFFITVAPTPWLQNHHAIFGKVTEHYDVVQTISRASTDWRDKPVEDVVVEKITIREAE